MRRLVGDHYLDLMPYPPGKPIEETERELGISNIIKLASNENPCGVAPKALAAMQAAIPKVSLYPDGNAFYLKEALCRHYQRYGFEPHHIILGNGTNEIIDLVIRAFLLNEENAVSAWPSFIMYRLGIKAFNRQEIAVPLTAGMHYDVEAMANAVTNTTKLMFIANPNNPTGTYITKAELEYLFDKVPQDVIIFMDEAYFEYVTRDDYPDAMQYLNQRERLIVSRTFSKIYGLAGIRIGYAMASQDMVGYLNRGREPFNTNLVAQAGAVAALEDSDFVRQAVELNQREMEFLCGEYDRLGLSYVPSVANFILVDFKRPILDIFQKLLHKGVIVRPMKGYQLPTHARITIGTHEQNVRLIRAIEEVVAT